MGDDVINENTGCINGIQEDSLDSVGFNTFILEHIEFWVSGGIKMPMSSGRLNKSRVLKEIKLNNMLVRVYKTLLANLLLNHYMFVKVTLLL